MFIITGAQAQADFYTTTSLKDFKDDPFLKPVINNYYGIQDIKGTQPGGK